MALLYSQTIDTFARILQSGYGSTYGSFMPQYGGALYFVANSVMELISNTDALYHNVEHTMQVTLVAQDIIRGKHIREGGVTPQEWTEFIISALCHDIGYVKGVCAGDDVQKGVFETGTYATENLFVETVILNNDTTDASLTPYHVSRGKLFIKQRFGKTIADLRLNLTNICNNIELTRFPVPNDEDHADVDGYPGLLRAADLIGQLSDPKYITKIPALFYEFVETGEAVKRGWKTPGDVKRCYPTFYSNVVMPYIGPALAHLRVTLSGRQVVSNLISQVESVKSQIN